MKAFISVDLEGLPYIVIPGQLKLKGSHYEEARKIATEITLRTINELFKNGFSKVVVADSHGPMVNLHPELLPERVEIIQGNPRAVSMVSGVEECDVALFLGYHAKAGTGSSTFDHTYSSESIHQLEINDCAVSEFLLNAFTTGEYNVPVVLVAGEEKLILEDVKEFGPNIEGVILKKSLSRIAAQSEDMYTILNKLQEGIEKAIKRYKEGKIKPLKVSKPIKIDVTFRSTLYADIAAYLPGSKRIDGLKVEYNADNMVEAYKTFQLLVAAASGVSAMYNNNLQ